MVEKMIRKLIGAMTQGNDIITPVLVLGPHARLFILSDSWRWRSPSIDTEAYIKPFSFRVRSLWPGELVL